MLNRLALFLFFISVVFLSFLGGLFSYYYDLRPAIYIRDNFEELQNFMETLWIDETLNVQKIEIGTLLKKSRIESSANVTGNLLFTLRFKPCAYLIDRQGNQLHEWCKSFHEVWQNPSHVQPPTPQWDESFNMAHMFPNGDLLAVYLIHGRTPYGGGIIKLDKDSNLLWSYAGTNHHFFHINEETGNIYALEHDFIISGDYIPGLSRKILNDYITILSADGKKLDRLSLIDAFLGTPYELLLHHYDPENRLWDTFHTNSVMVLTESMAQHFPMFKAGQILLSIRNLNTIAILDPESRKIVWAYTGIWRKQHSATFMTNGNILLFDNLGGTMQGRSHSRILQFNPRSNQVVWQYGSNEAQSFYSYAYGQVNETPDGNILITNSLGLRILEITPAREPVWNMAFPALWKKPHHVKAGRYYGNINSVDPKDRESIEIKDDLFSVPMSSTVVVTGTPIE